MAALPAAERTLRTVVQNPLLLVAALPIAIGSGLVSAGSQIPVAGAVLGVLFGLGFFVVEPFLAGGLLGVSRDALAGDAALEAFIRHGKRVYLRLLAARLAQVLLTLIFFGAFFVAVAILVIALVGIGSLTSGSPEAAIGALGILGIVFLVGGFIVITVTYYLIGFAIQFHPAAIVVEDADLVESVKRSVGVVRANPLSALGYSVLVAVVSGAIGAIPAGYIAITGGLVEMLGQENPEAFLGIGLLNAVIYFVLVTVIQTLLLPFVRTYHVAFYLEATRTGE